MSGRTSGSSDEPSPSRRKRDSTGDRATAPPAGEDDVGPADPSGAPSRPVPPDPVWSESFDPVDEDWDESPVRARDARDVLKEIATIQAELARHTPRTDAPAVSPADEPPERVEDERAKLSDRSRWGKPSPYLEERLTVARSAADRLTSEAQQVERSVSDLKEDAETIDRELGRATDELGFLFSSEASDHDSPNPSAVRPSGVGDGAYGGEVARSAAAAAPSPPPSSPASTYSHFTVGRYNDPGTALQARRRPLAWGTVVLAAGISALLFVLTLRAYEPLPVVWLAVLPLIWMIPVPFFVAAFLGTPRVVKRNRLDLREAT